jgi:hypothetical protein
MQYFITHMRANRTELLRKSVGILSLTVAILCLVSSMALANPSVETRERAAGTILMQGKGAVLPLDESELPGDGFTLPSRGENDGQAPGAAVTPTDSNGDTSGYKTKTVVLQKPSEHPKPTIFLIEERSNNGHIYLGLLSLTIPW